MKCEIQNACNAEHVPSDGLINTWVNAALIASSVDDKSITIRVISRDESRSLNHAFRHIDKPTNVLSFADDPFPGETSDYFGDIAICMDVVVFEAADLGISLDAHFAHMVVHGVLHLLGYDHINEADSLVMESLETQVLAKVGFDNPYE